MRTPAIVLLTTSLFSAAAMAASPVLPQGTPPSVLNPPAYAPNKAMSVDNKLPGDTDLANDAKTLQGLDGDTSTNPTVQSTQRLVDTRDHYVRLNNQLGADVRNHASKDTIQQDREAIVEAKKQLDLDTKACITDVKAAGGQVAACAK